MYIYIQITTIKKPPTMKNLSNLLSEGKILVNKASYYFNIGNTTVRVSNHLPKRTNWEENENSENKVFIFINENNDLTDTKIEKYLENEFSGDYLDFFLFDTEQEAIESILYIKNKI